MAAESSGSAPLESQTSFEPPLSTGERSPSVSTSTQLQQQADRTDRSAQTVLAQPAVRAPGTFEAFVARSVLPALNFPSSERATTASVPTSSLLDGHTESGTLDVEETQEYIRRGLPATRVVKTPCPYDLFQFNKDSLDIEVIPVEAHINFQELESLIKKYKAENKNVVFVQIPQGITGNGKLMRFAETSLKRHFGVENIPPLLHSRVETTSALRNVEDVLGPRAVLGAVREVNVQSTDRAILNGIEIRPTGLRQEKPENQKWIVYFNPNAGTWGQKTQFLAETARDVGANVICCNYRGVERSSGFPLNDQALIDDGDAIVRYLREQGVLAKNIVVCGTSLGGAVATHVAAKRVESGERVSLISDRSFSSLSSVVWKIEGIFNKILPILAHLARTIAIAIVRYHDWKLDSGEKLKGLLANHANVTVMHHAEDRIIPVGAQAVDALSEEQRSGRTIELTEPKDNRNFFKRLFSSSVDAHNRQLHANEHARFVQAAQGALGITRATRDGFAG